MVWLVIVYCVFVAISTVYWPDVNFYWLTEQTSLAKSVSFISQKFSEITARDWLSPTISDHVKGIYSRAVKNQEKY